MEMTWSVLPSDIEKNILSRLPVKSLMRFRCVSKHWCNLVTDPDFIKMHLNRFSQITEGHKLVHTYGGKVYSVDMEAIQCIKTREQKDKLQRQLILPFQNGPSRVIGSCNGLLCFYTFGSLYLLNPATNEYKDLSLPSLDRMLLPPVFGFGYSHRTDEYKVMVISHYRISQSVYCDEVYVYTLGTNSDWRSIGDTEYLIVNERDPILVNGALHWMAKVKRSSRYFGFTFNYRKVLVSFDIGDEKFREVSLPKCFSQKDTDHSMIFVELDGFLSLYHYKSHYKGGKFDIWVMKDYGDEQSWTKTFSVAKSMLSNKIWKLKPLYILKEDEEILCGSHKKIYVLNLIEEKIDTLFRRRGPSETYTQLYYYHRHGPSEIGTQIYFESLVSLRTHGGIDREATNRTEGKRKEEV